MRRLPPLNALRAFEATARLSSVTAAAKELCVSHSAVSQKVKQLEDYFGQQLFTRARRRVEPTPAALAYLEDVRASFDRLALASDHLTRRGAQRLLTISATPSFAMRWLIPRTAAFQAAHPQVDLRISTSQFDDIAQLAGPYDFVIRRQPMAREGHVCRMLVDDVSTPLLAPAAAGKRTPKSPADLLKTPLLHLRSRPDAWKRWFTENGVTASETLDGPYFDHFFLSLQAAISGIGVAMGPYALVEDDLANGRLVAPFPDKTLTGPGFHMMFRPELADDRGGRKFLRWLQKETHAELF